MRKNRHEPLIVTAVLTPDDRQRFSDMDIDSMLRRYEDYELSGSERTQIKRKRIGKAAKGIMGALLDVFLGILFLWIAITENSGCNSCAFGSLGAVCMLSAVLFAVKMIKSALPQYRLQAGTADEVCTFVFGEKLLFVYSESQNTAYCYDGLPDDCLELTSIVELTDGFAIKTYNSCYWLPARFIDAETGERLLERISRLPAGRDGKPHVRLSRICFPEAAQETPAPFFADCPDAQPVAEFVPHPDEIDEITVTYLALYNSTLALVEDCDTWYIPLKEINDIKRSGRDYEVSVGGWSSTYCSHSVILAHDGSDDAAAANFFAAVSAQ